MTAVNVFERLRLGLGVNAKSETLAILIEKHGVWFSALELAEKLTWSESAIQRALRDLARAGLVSRSTARPALYSVSNSKSDVWAQLVSAGDVR